MGKGAGQGAWYKARRNSVALCWSTVGAECHLLGKEPGLREKRLVPHTSEHPLCCLLLTEKQIIVASSGFRYCLLAYCVCDVRKQSTVLV